ncbi:MAG: ABC transporter permease [Phycisphaerae bacterium]
MKSDAVFIMQQAVTASVPLTLAGIGELVAERAGIINVGLEGLMLIGCIAAYAGAAFHGVGYHGILAAAAAGMILAALFAWVTIWARADQIVAGTAINLLAAGLSATAWAYLEPRIVDLPASAGFVRTPIPGLAQWPIIGPIFFDQYGLCYVLGTLLLAVWLLLARTRAGLILRSLGEAPDACDALGLPVRWWRTGAVLFSGLTAGVAGSYLAIMRNHQFTPDMTGGQGFLVLALVIFGRWSIPGLLLGCLFFGALESLQQFLQGSEPFRQFLLLHLGIERLPYQLFKMLPYVAALLALALFTRGQGGPAALGKPWPERVY